MIPPRLRLQLAGFGIMALLLVLAAWQGRQVQPEDAAPNPPASAPRFSPGTDTGEQQRFMLVIGAALAQTRGTVTYDGRYVPIAYPGGDVPPDRGVCTDVLIRAYREVGIDLQQQVHEDMLAAFPAYPQLWGLTAPDPNIDHRRVPNLMVFFQRQGACQPMTTNPGDYYTGDVVAWDLGGGAQHIGLVSDRPVAGTGRYLIIHNMGRGPMLNDCLFTWQIIGHYRYPAAPGPAA